MKDDKKLEDGFSNPSFSSGNNDQDREKIDEHRQYDSPQESSDEILNKKQLHILQPLFVKSGEDLALAFSQQTGRSISSSLVNIHLKRFADYRDSLSTPCCFFKYHLNSIDFIGLEPSWDFAKRICQFFKSIDSFYEINPVDDNLNQSDIILLKGAINQAFPQLLKRLEFKGNVSKVELAPEKIKFRSDNEMILVVQYSFSIYGSDENPEETHRMNMIIERPSVSRLFSSIF